MNLAIAREQSVIRVRPSGETQGGSSGGTWFWALLILGVGGFVAYDYAKGNLSVTKNPERRKGRDWLRQGSRIAVDYHDGSRPTFGTVKKVHSSSMEIRLDDGKTVTLPMEWAS